MFVIKRNQIIITALVVMIAIAGYLNYVDNPSKKDNTAVMANETTAELAVTPNEENLNSIALDDKGDIVALENTADVASVDDTKIDTVAVDPTATPDSATNENTGEAIFVSNPYDETFFVSAKLEREQARSKEKDLLMEVINSTGLDKEDKSKSADSMRELADRIQKETSAEAMIEAKGFKDAYVRIDDNTVDVVVSKATLSDAEIAQIEDIVKRKTGATVDQIRIIPLKR